MPTPDPTPEEIAAACLAIQAGWTDHEREQRRWKATHVGNRRDEPMTVEVVDAGVFFPTTAKTVQ